MIWGAWSDLWAFVKGERNRSAQNQITYRLGLPKVCVHLPHHQNGHRFRIFWDLLVLFGLGIMLEEGICEVWILGFMRSKSSNLEVQIIWGIDVEMGPYLWRHKYFVKEVHWWIVVYCMGVWEVAFDLWFLKIFICFLGGIKGRVKISDFMKVFKIVI